MPDLLLATVALGGGSLFWSGLLALVLASAPPKKTRPRPSISMVPPKVGILKRAEDSNIWVALIAAAGVIGAAVAPHWFKNKSEKVQTKTNEEYAALLMRLSNMVDRLKEFEQHGAQRIILFWGHNSGGFPMSGHPYYVTASQFHVSKGFDASHIESYRHLQVDDDYLRMLAVGLVSEDRTIHNTTKTMPPCKLRRYYELEKVTDSLLCVLGVQGPNLYFISASRYEGEFTNEDKTAVSLMSHAIWEDMNEIAAK